MLTVEEFLDNRPVDLLAFGEPTHREPAFTRARDELFKRLVARGFRSIVVEVDRVVARAIDDYVNGRSDEAPAGRHRSLAEWMRGHNESGNERLSFHGFDAPAAEQQARNLLARRTGPILVAAHNRQLRRNASSAGANRHNDRYAVIVGSLGSSAALGLGPPAADTFEGLLCSRAGHGPLFATAEPGVTRTDVTPEQQYVPLDADTVADADAIWHVDLFPPAAAALAERIRRLPRVESQQSGPDLGVPDIAWDDWFFFNGADRKHPFATIVSHDIPGFDQRSALDRSGVYRLNLDLGRDEFRRLFGYGPEEFKQRRDSIDFARFDEFVPHPVYGTQSWASVVNPGTRSAEHVDRLLAHAYGRRSHGQSRSGA